MCECAGCCGQQQGLVQELLHMSMQAILATRALHLGQKNAWWTICRQAQQACSTAAASLCCMQPAATASLSTLRPKATSLKPSCA